MAGVGFELNKLLAKQGYTGLMQAYGYAALIGSGPWLVSVISLGMLGAVLTTVSNADELQMFFGTISLVYAVTLVLSGPIQMVLTRHAADQEYARQPERIYPTFVFSIAWSMLMFSLVGLVLFVGCVPGPLLFRLAAAMLTALVGGIWVAGIFLTAIKDYAQVLWGFAIGSVTSFGGAWLGSQWTGTTGAMVGFTLGHAVLLLLLFRAIYKEVGNREVGDPEFLRCFRKYWQLALCGLFYNLGIWIDKFLFWWLDPSSEQIAGLLHSAPVYDRVVYFAFLTIVPGMAVFLLKLETDFAVANDLFFQHVLKKGTLAQVTERKQGMITALQEGFSLLLKVQGLFTIVLILGAERILPVIGLGAVQAGIFQIALIGTFLLVIFMSLLMVLHYLDKRRDAMIACAVFAGTNLVVTWGSIVAGERWFGIGFLVAAGLGTVLAGFWVNQHVRNLEYATFTPQPLYG